MTVQVNFVDVQPWGRINRHDANDAKAVLLLHRIGINVNFVKRIVRIAERLPTGRKARLCQRSQ
jgi:hypothetical protein